MGIQLDTVRTFRWQKDGRNATRVDCHGHQEAMSGGEGEYATIIEAPKKWAIPGEPDSRRGNNTSSLHHDMSRTVGKRVRAGAEV
jgi:hypothetical protein